MLLRRRHFLCSVAAWPVLCSSSGIPSSELVSESRCFFPITRRLSLGERRTSQRSTSFFLLLRTRYLLPPTTVSHKPRSRIKSGMTTLGYRDNLAFRHSELVSASSSWFLISSPRTADRQRWTSFSCSYEPATCYHRPRFFSQISSKEPVRSLDKYRPRDYNTN